NTAGTTETISSISAGSISFNPASVSSLSVKTGSGADTVDVFRNAEQLTLSSNGGTDNVVFGAASGPGVQGIVAPVTVTDAANFTTVSVNETGDTTGRTISYSAGPTVTMINAAPAPILFNNSDISAVTITTGSGADTVQVLSSQNALTLASAGGIDSVMLG